MKAVDLHVHSCFSDGTKTPKELLNYARWQKLSAFALTDHDTISGVDALNMAHMELLNSEPDATDIPDIIPGVELSTEYNGRDIHIVGLFIDVKSEAFNSYLKEFVDSRDVRNQKMCKLLCEREGFDISYEKLIEAFPGAVITRAHYARYLLDKGYIKSMKEAFDRYIGDHSPCYIPREKVTPSDGVRLIHSAGGVAILAHPVLYGYSQAELDKLVLSIDGLDGIEAVYSTYTPSDERDIKRLAQKYNLLLSGGSDYHGENKPDIELGTGRGHLFVPEDFLDKIRAFHKAL